MQSAAASKDTHHQGHDEDADYAELLTSARDALDGCAGPLFTTSAAGLFDTFIGALPAERRQHYTCRACARFIDTYGGLVTIDDDGAATPVFWSAAAAPRFFRTAVERLEREVRRAVVTGVFLSSDPLWGVVENASPKSPTGAWRHLCTVPDAKLVHRHALLTAGQAMAEKRQDLETLGRALAEFNIDVVRQAHALLKTESLYRSEKALGVAEWMLRLHETRAAAKSARARINHTWRSVASAPAGFCHVRSSMIGTLLEDIAAGKPFDDVARAFAAKMNPLQYQRPQAAPTAGNIAQAEAIVAKLGIARALERRFARLDELLTLWRPAPPSPSHAPGGMFAHLTPKAAPSRQVTADAPPVRMTWEKFARVALPEARRIELYVPTLPASFCAFVTAAHDDAPPILQWDAPERRNPVSWYVYGNGSSARDWNMSGGSWAPLTAIAPLPCHWHTTDGFKHFARGALLVVDGAFDARHETAGNAIFPETLKSEMHAVRSTIEAYSRSAKLGGADAADAATACGLLVRAGQTTATKLRVTDAHGVVVAYEVDRWD